MRKDQRCFFHEILLSVAVELTFTNYLSLFATSRICDGTAVTMMGRNIASIQCDSDWLSPARSLLDTASATKNTTSALSMVARSKAVRLRLATSRSWNQAMEITSILFL